VRDAGGGVERARTLRTGAALGCRAGAARRRGIRLGRGVDGRGRQGPRLPAPDESGRRRGRTRTAGRRDLGPVPGAPAPPEPSLDGAARRHAAVRRGGRLVRLLPQRHAGPSRGAPRAAGVVPGGEGRQRGRIPDDAGGVGRRCDPHRGLGRRVRPVGRPGELRLPGRRRRAGRLRRQPDQSSLVVRRGRGASRGDGAALGRPLGLRDGVRPRG
jgi:hypothetical protein